ncbi:beta-ketoacyl synthase N-terminal-like domain-containing protein [Kitasatospora sp. MBT66]|uniref:beta-ketoacyl synthase N-terminal-like domain-containing protein n=1 Tax=Kitasatospora sp. MBT66 TaxID=1444769 RepID=UPI0005BCA95F|nr:beta-ketoacyl synthase N-terminal-like domain-containing protein [Kitasatospora sp. MBT66]
MSARRAVITGIGVVAPSGVGSETHWKSVCGGESRIAPITLFDAGQYETTLAGEVPDFDVNRYVERRLQVQTDRWTHLAYAAAELAFGEAELDPSTVEPYKLSVALASSSGGNQFGQRELQRLWQPDTSRTVGAYQSIAWFYAATVGQLAIKHQAKGPSSVLVSEGAGGLDSLAHAARLVRRGADVVLAGGTEAPLGPYALACQQRSGRLYTGSDPAEAYLPFDERAAGFVPGEGGVVFVVEDLDHALARGARIRAEIAGWSATQDAVASTRTGSGSVRQYARALGTAVERAGLTPGDVDVTFPDAVGLPAYDRTEAEALRAVFGDAGPAAVTTQKPLTGRLYQGGSALDAATAVLAMDNGLIPPSAGPARPADGCDLAFVREERAAEVRTALIGARGFDGFNSAVLLRAHS